MAGVSKKVAGRAPRQTYEDQAVNRPQKLRVLHRETVAFLAQPASAALDGSVGCVGSIVQQVPGSTHW